MTIPPVDVVIACHSPQRQLARAVESVLDGSDTVAGVTVVAHNMEPKVLSSLLSSSHNARVRFLDLQDGIKSPAGPFNLGIETSESPWVALMGSDDYLQRGAIESWLSLSEGADTVVPRLVHERGGVVPTPPVRPFLHRRRWAVKDRLYYRSAPLGLLRKGFLEDNSAALSSGLPTGEDLPLSVMVYSKGLVSVQRRGPAYVIGGDAPDRVTMQMLPLARELAHTDQVWSPRVAGRLSSRQRTALGTKYIRIHFFGVAHYRAMQGTWNRDDREVIAEKIRLVLEKAPNADKPLSIADRRLLDALLDPTVPNSRVDALAVARRRFGTPLTLIPRDLSYIAQREAPIRFMTASMLVR